MKTIEKDVQMLNQGKDYIKGIFTIFSGKKNM